MELKFPEEVFYYPAEIKTDIDGVEIYIDSFGDIEICDGTFGSLWFTADQLRQLADFADKVKGGE